MWSIFEPRRDRESQPRTKESNSINFKVMDMSKYLLSFVPRTESAQGTKSKSKSFSEPSPHGYDNTSSKTRGRNTSSNRQQVRPSTPTDEASNSSSSKSPTKSTTDNNSSSGGGATAGAPAKLCCDKCDGKHLTENCPYFKKKRDDHPDAQKNFYKKLGGSSTLPHATVSRATVIRQPGDGSCLFHSMSYGLGSRYNARIIRKEICAFIKSNPEFKISETPLRDWIKWDSGTSCSSYASRMSGGAWGGGIEMAVASNIYRVNVHVYERSGGGGYRRISAFDYPDRPESRNTVRVVYQGGVHYDALVF